MGKAHPRRSSNVDVILRGLRVSPVNHPLGAPLILAPPRAPRLRGEPFISDPGRAGRNRPVERRPSLLTSTVTAPSRAVTSQVRPAPAPAAAHCGPVRCQRDHPQDCITTRGPTAARNLSACAWWPPWWGISRISASRSPPRAARTSIASAWMSPQSRSARPAASTRITIDESLAPSNDAEGDGWSQRHRLAPTVQDSPAAAVATSTPSAAIASRSTPTGPTGSRAASRRSCGVTTTRATGRASTMSGTAE